MIRLTRSFLTLWLLLILALSASAAEIQPIKYVFLFIGDGMSIPQIQMTEEFLQKTENRGLKLHSMPYRSITTTHGADVFVTESAAAATAIASGSKTTSGGIGLDAEGNRVETIAELALKNGRKVGILSSVTINHATPAAFYAHNPSRGNGYEIGLDLIASNFHYFGGGGVSQNNDTNARLYRGDIYDLAKEAGYTVCRTAEEIRNLKPGGGKVMAFSNSDAISYAIDSGKDEIRLPEFTKQAIELLDNPNGFFMMVEGGKIDWACHGNDAATAVHDTIEFDNAVSVAFDFAEKNPGDVLIVVTGDHETGMLSVSHSTTGSQVYVALLANQKASKDVIAVNIEKFVKNNPSVTFEQFKPFITEQTGLIFTDDGVWKRGTLSLTKDEMKILEDDFAVSKKAIEENSRAGKDKVALTMVRLVNNKSGLTWGGGGHTGLPVVTATWGNQAAEIALNVRDNTDIGKQLKQAVAPLSAKRGEQSDQQRSVPRGINPRRIR